MHHVTIRANVVELLAAGAASMALALLVLVGGLAMGESTTVPGVTTAFAVTSDVLFMPPEDEETGPKSYLCCAMVYADPGMSR